MIAVGSQTIALLALAAKAQRHLPVRRLQEDARKRVAVAIPIQLQAPAARTWALHALLSQA